MIEEKEYKQRRQRFAKQLKKNSVALFLSAKIKTRSHDTEYPYRQESNFYYLTGFKEELSALLFVKSKKKIKTYLFVQKKDPVVELWNGERLGVKKVKKHFDVDDVFEIEILQDLFKKLVSTQKRYFYYDFSREREVASFKSSVEFKEYCDLRNLVGTMRLIKSPAEIKLIKKALEITKEAHHRLMKMQKIEKFEYELQAELEYIFKKNGAYNDAYTSIVAGGNSANILHYIKNNKKLFKGEWILIDAGCEYDYYASDITRTIPVNENFTQAQIDVYSLVLDVEVKIIEMIAPGVKRSDLQKKAVELLVEGMLELGILKGTKKKIIKKELYKKYYPHGIGHWLGIDVHDASPYKDENGKEIPFQEGMVLTIEPGLYFQYDDKMIPKKYRGFGVRIEDNIVVTEGGYENLSEGIVKSIEDIKNFLI